MLVRLITFIAVSLLSITAHATPCADDNASGCAHTAVQAAENNLASLYQQLLEQQGKGSLLSKRLINTQRAWQIYRDAECEYIGAYGEEHGEHQAAYERCVQSLIEQRMRALQHYQQCQASGEPCGVAAP